VNPWIVMRSRNTGEGVAAILGDSGNWNKGTIAMDLMAALRGLKSEATYQVRMPEGYGPDRIVTGRELMEIGLTIAFGTRGAGAIIPIQSTSLPGPFPESIEISVKFGE